MPNGLRLLVKANHSSEIVAMNCLVRVGLADEPEDQAGIAALLAETILRGTQSHPPAVMAQAMLAAGGTLRAAPGFDFTELTMVTTRERFPTAIRMLAEVVREASLAPEAIDAARDELLRRIEALDDDLDDATYDTIRAELYRSAPYGRPVYGYPSTLKSITRRDLERFYRRFYAQNNISVAVVGDIDPKPASDAVLQAFGSIPEVPPSSRTAPAPETLAAPRVRLLQKPGPSLQVMAGYLVPAATPTTYPVLMVLDAILGGGKRARLFANIREKQGIGYRLGSFYQPLRFQSHLIGYVVTNPYRANVMTGEPEPVADIVRALLLAQFQDLAENGPTDAEVTRAKTYVTGHYALLHERNADQAHWLAWTDAMRLGVEFDQAFAAKISSVTKEQIQTASKDYFKNHALVVTMPDGDDAGTKP